MSTQQNSKHALADVEDIEQELKVQPTRPRGRPFGTTKKSKEEEHASNVPQELKRNYLVKTKIGRLNIVQKGGKRDGAGRKRKYTVVKMRNRINNYFTWCESNDRVPSIKGLMLFLDLTRDSFYTYLAVPEFTSMMENVKMIISEWVENDIYRTPGAAAGKIAYAKNLHGWTDKMDTTNTNINETTIKTIKSVDEAKALIASMAPLLLAQLNGQTLKQLSILDAEVMETTNDRTGTKK